MADDPYGIGDLAAFNQSVMQNDPYGIMGRSIGAWQPDTSTWSPTEVGVTSFGKSFLSGLMSNYARQNSADQLNSVIGVLPQLRSDPTSVVAPEGVNSDAFAVLKSNQVMRNYMAQAQKEQSLTEMMQKVGLAGLTKEEEILAEDRAKSKLGLNAANDPTSAGYKADKDKEDRLITIRKEFNALEPVKNFAKASQAANALAGALKDKNKVADQELVRYSILMIEPGMAVREGEQGAVANSQSIPDAWKGQLQSALSGDSVLGVEVREGIKNLASRAYGSHKNLYDQANDMYSKEATLQGLDPSRLSYLGTPPEASSIFGSTTPESPVNGKITLPQGVDVQKLAEEAAILKSNGATPQEIAEALRQKYQKMMMPMSGGTPFG